MIHRRTHMEKDDDGSQCTVRTPAGLEEVSLFDCDAITIQVPVHIVWAVKQAEAEERMKASVRPPARFRDPKRSR